MIPQINFGLVVGSLPPPRWRRARPRTPLTNKGQRLRTDVDIVENVRRAKSSSGDVKWSLGHKVS